MPKDSLNVYLLQWNQSISVVFIITRKQKTFSPGKYLKRVKLYMMKISYGSIN